MEHKISPERLVFDLSDEIFCNSMATATIEATLRDFFRIANDYRKTLSPEILTFSAGILFLSFVFQLWRSSKKRINGKPLPPGRFGLPFIGETLDFLQTQKRNKSWEFVEKRATEYGEVFKTSLIGDPTVCASSPAGNKMVFTNENKLVNVSWPGSVIDVLGKRSLIALKGEEAKRIRNAVMTFLRPEALQMYTTRADANVRRFMERYWEGKEQVKVYPLMKRFAFSLACELLMSRYDEKEQQMLEEPFTTMMKGILQLPINLPGTRYRKAMSAAKMLRSTFQKWLDERRKDLEQGKVAADHDLLTCLLTFRDENGQGLTDEDMNDNILLLLFAGHDTSLVVTTMVCKFLAENPTVFEEVWKEHEEIAAGKEAEEALNWADLQKMKLSWRVVQETMRLQPPVQGAFRVAIKDMEYAGFSIPKSWKLYWTVNSTHRNPKYFKEPTKFDPARFEGTGPTPYSYVPFGGGPRMCPGNEFARMEALVLMHHLVRRFSWSLVDPNETISVDPMPAPQLGLPIWLHRRSS